MMKAFQVRAVNFLLSGYWLNWFIAVLSVASSVFAVYYTVKVSHKPDDATRGGAVGTAICLGFLFAGTSVPAQAIKDQLLLGAKSRGDAAAHVGKNQLPVTEDMGHRARNTELALKIHLAWISSQRWPLAIGSFVGTIFWGFGDNWAEAFLAYPACGTVFCGLARIEAQMIGFLHIVTQLL